MFSDAVPHSLVFEIVEKLHSKMASLMRQAFLIASNCIMVQWMRGVKMEGLSYTCKKNLLWGSVSEVSVFLKKGDLSKVMT